MYSMSYNLVTKTYIKKKYIFKILKYLLYINIVFNLSKTTNLYSHENVETLFFIAGKHSSVHRHTSIMVQSNKGQSIRNPPNIILIRRLAFLFKCQEYRKKNNMLWPERLYNKALNTVHT